jgi:hypothetical protein
VPAAHRSCPRTDSTICTTSTGQSVPVLSITDRRSGKGVLPLVDSKRQGVCWTLGLAAGRPSRNLPDPVDSTSIVGTTIYSGRDRRSGEPIHQLRPGSTNGSLHAYYSYVASNCGRPWPCWLAKTERKRLIAAQRRRQSMAENGNTEQGKARDARHVRGRTRANLSGAVATFQVRQNDVT